MLTVGGVSRKRKSLRTDGLVNCNLRVQAGPEIKGEVTSPSWENREKFTASREKCFDGGHTTEAWLYYKLI